MNKIYTIQDMKDAFNQGELNSNICYKRSFDNFIEIKNNKLKLNKITDKEYKDLIKVIKPR